MSKTLVIVESPTKAKTISKYLGKDFTVLSSFGHVRDLPKSKMGVDIENHFEPSYVVPTKAKKQVLALKKAAGACERVLLATDEDREGEAIAWHIAELLKLDLKEKNRITFHEITKSAILQAIESPRALLQPLVDAQQTRRILDRLVGYELSPFLWKKVRRGLSAGRVQSVAMRLVVERERERDAFVIDEYWSIDAVFEKASLTFPAKLTRWNNEKVEKLTIGTQEQAQAMREALVAATYTVGAIEKKEVKKSPPRPYTTSTLQIDANNKLSMSAKQTMRLAQQLYETGRITYMRTDSVNLAEKFLDETQGFLAQAFGAQYATGAKHYKTKDKGAQEAHEAIRPTEVGVLPGSLEGEIEPRAIKLYDLIWRRAVASQMPEARLERTAVDLVTDKATFRANGSTIIFDGFMQVYQSAKEKILPILHQNDPVALNELTANQHFTEPPARYSDATLVKSLEEHGIGRPSTYAPTISTIIDRGYVERDDAKKLLPTSIAFIVNDVLVNHFDTIVDVEFTAKMERTLDEIAEGTVQWVPTLEAFYGPFHKNLEEKSESLNREDIMPDRTIGTDPKTKKTVFVKTGPWGEYVQLGELDEESSEKPRRTSLLRDMAMEQVTLEQALELLSWPKSLGKDTQGNDIVINNGRFGPYLKAGETSASIGEENPLAMTLERARELIHTAAERSKLMKTPIAKLGVDPTSKGEIEVKHGRYGPYVTDGTTNVSIKKTQDPETLTREEAIELLIKKRANPGRGARVKKAPAKKKTPKKK